MVEHGRSVYRVPSRDEGALADAIVRLLRDKELYRQFGANGKRKADSEWSPNIVAQQTVAVYHRAIGDTHSSTGKKRWRWFPRVLPIL